jgi:hypothetical protein
VDEARPLGDTRGMGDDTKPRVARDGIHVGDVVIRPVPVRETDDHLDTSAGRERDRSQEEDAHAAQHSAGEPPPAPAGIVPVGEGGDVDASIQAAREAVQGAGELPIPILLHDPLTGKIIGSA